MEPPISGSPVEPELAGGGLAALGSNSRFS